MQFYTLLFLVLSFSTTYAAHTLTGSAVIREKIAVPPDATFTAVLLDVSQADAPAQEIGRYEATPAGYAPYTFAIAYDADKINAANSYGIRATLTVAGKLLFTTDQMNAVLTHGAPSTIEVIMHRVSERSDTDTTNSEPPVTLPQTFSGTLPCADCQGVKHHLDLWPDHVFHLSREWIGNPPGHGPLRRDEIGRWVYDLAQRRLTLQGGGEMPLELELVDTGSLRWRGFGAEQSASDSRYDLTGSGALTPAELSLFVQGMFVYVADSAVLRECLTGRTYPVGSEGSYRELEDAYRANRSAPGAPLMVSIEAEIRECQGMEGAPRPEITVQRFVNAWPGQSCPQ